MVGLVVVEDGVVDERTYDACRTPGDKDATVDGIGWLPRLIPKAEAKLRGEMPPDLMYGCGGDRKFFRVNGIDPAQLLREVWQARGNNDLVIGWVKKNRKLAA